MERVWYVAYGTNLSYARFRCYLSGGKPEGGSHTHAGCRDQTEPAADAAVEIPGGLAFTGSSTVWGGGLAVYDAHRPGRVAARAYLVTVEQFADVVAQERHQPVGADLDLAPLHAAGSHALGPGRYETLVRVGTQDALPMVTFTDAAADERPLTPPAAAYLRTMAAGLRESRDWSRRRIASYLAGIAGTAHAWTHADIEGIIA